MHGHNFFSMWHNIGDDQRKDWIRLPEATRCGIQIYDHTGCHVGIAAVMDRVARVIRTHCRDPQVSMAAPNPVVLPDTPEDGPILFLGTMCLNRCPP